MAKLNIGAVGAVINTLIRNADTKAAINVSAATTKDMLLESPKGATKIRASSFTTDGTDGKLKYITIAGDLDESGDWKVSVHLITPSIDKYSNYKVMTVYNPN